MSDTHSPEVRSYNMSRICSTGTRPEEIVRKYLFSRGLRYRKNVSNLPGKPDVVLPRYKTVIFVNGCFWHMHNCDRFVWPKSNVNYWKDKLSRNAARDLINAEKLTEAGWHVIVIWECELSRNRITSTLEKLFDQITIRNES